MNTFLRSVALLALAAAIPARAAEPKASPPPAGVSQPPPPHDDRIGIEVVPKLGGLVPWSKLGATWNADLELGYLTPLLNRQLAVVIDTGYTQPTQSRVVSDTRVGGGSFNYTLTQRELNFFIGPKYFIFPTTETLLPFVAVGLKLQLLRTEVVGSANGQALGENDETSTQVGGALRGGCGYKLGPGHLVGELEVAYAGVSETITGSSNVADVSLQVGYLFIF